MFELKEIELKSLIQKLEIDPSNLDLINNIAIAYVENPLSLEKNEDLKYFELAYKTKKTIKSTHNLAWFLYFESEEEERAIKLQNECINMEPKSSYPFYLFGYMLLSQKKYKEAINYLDKAINIEYKREIEHHLGYCYFQLNQFQKAKQYFDKSASINDIENLSLYNLGLTEFKIGNLESTERIANTLANKIGQEKSHNTVSIYEVGIIYFLLNKDKEAINCLYKGGLERIDIVEWEALSYCLYNIDKTTWDEQIKKGIDERTKWITEIKSNHEDWSDDSEEEKEERLVELQSEIKIRQSIIENGLKRPKPNLKELLVEEYCGCLLFDCKEHGNIEND